MRELIYISVEPNNLYYVWQVNVWLESANKHGILDKCHVLIYKPDAHVEWLPEWNIVEKLYPEAKFFRYDDRGIRNLLQVYIPILRPHTLQQHFAKYPELKEKAIFYHDCDIILNRALDIEKYLDDDVNYVSNTVVPSDYMSHKYFESKRRDVKPEMQWEYDKIDVLEEAAQIVGISKDVIISNYNNTGGAQYLLKNIDSKFWKKVEKDSFELVLYLKSINRRFFENEAKGFQSWCSDMWAVLWNIWKIGAETLVVPEMSFCWATDVIKQTETHPILHNAGVTSESTIRTRINNLNGEGKIFIDAPAFYKGRYHQGSITPFRDYNYINTILLHPTSKGYCFYKYLQEVINIKNKYNLSY